MPGVNTLLTAVAQKIGGSIPGSSSPHVEVALGKLLNPKLLPKAVLLGMNVYE